MEKIITYVAKVMKDGKEEYIRCRFKLFCYADIIELEMRTPGGLLTRINTALREKNLHDILFLMKRILLKASMNPTGLVDTGALDAMLADFAKNGEKGEKFINTLLGDIYVDTDSMYPKSLLNKEYGTAGYVTYKLGSYNLYGHIKNVIFNEPATIVFWKDGTKTVVKAMEGEAFDPEKGLAMAIVKKINGEYGNYNKIFKKWVPTYMPKEEELHSDWEPKIPYSEITEAVEKIKSGVVDAAKGPKRKLIKAIENTGDDNE